MMRPTNSTEALYFALLVALGLPALAACGGSATDADGAGGTGTGGTGSGVGGTGGSTGGGTGGSGGTIATGTPCTNPTENETTGLVDCDEGYAHRPSATACAVNLPRSPIGPTSMDPAFPDECESDEECPGDYAYCTPSFLVPGGHNVCGNGCVTDDDCGEGSLCSCGTEFGICVSATCETDDDCKAGFLCLDSLAWPDGCVGTAPRPTERVFSCHQGQDECLTDGECTPVGQECLIRNESRVCLSMSSSACGRPFLVEWAARTAETTRSNDWLDRVDVSLDGLSGDERRSLAEHYERIALMEHASIAAFARFTLELLALGAPAALVEEANAALVDETRHARLCFGIASRYRGSPVGPTALSMHGALGEISLEHSLRTAVLEGCIGETQAALEARLAAERSDDDVLRSVLLGIADDETRHAALAFRFVEWAIGQDPRLATLLPSILDDEERARSAPPSSTLPASLLRRGRLEDRESFLVGTDARRSVTRPCLEAIVQRSEQRAERARAIV